MMSRIEDYAQRLIAVSNKICEESPLDPITDADLVWIKRKFAAWKFPLPTELIEIWKITAGLPWHDYDESLLKVALGVKNEDAPDVDRLVDYDIERYDILNLGNARHTSFTMNRDGMTSLATMTFEIQPQSFPYSFEEGFCRYVEAVEREVAEGLFDEEEDEEF